MKFLYNSILCRKIRVISQMYFIRAHARANHDFSIHFSTKLFRRKKSCGRNIESVLVRYKSGISDFIGILSTKLRELLRAIHVYVSPSEGTRRLIRVVALALALSPIVFGSSAKTCSRSSRRELLLLSYFFFSLIYHP